MLHSALTALIRDNPHSTVQFLSRIKASFYKVIFLSWESIVCNSGTIKFPGHLCVLGKRILTKRSCSLEGEEGNDCPPQTDPVSWKDGYNGPQGGCWAVGQRQFGWPQKGRALKWNDLHGPSVKLSQTDQRSHPPGSDHFQDVEVAQRINRILHWLSQMHTHRII